MPGRSRITVSLSDGSTASAGSTAAPTPAPTSAWIVALTSDRNANSGSIPRARSCASTRASPRHSVCPISGVSARSASGRRRRVAPDDEHVRVAHQLERLERPGRQRQLDEAQVDVAALDRVIEREVGGRLDGTQRDVRPVDRIPPHQGREDANADRLRDADAQRARLPGGERRDVGLRRLQTGEDRVGVLQDELARLGQLDADAAARALDEPLADRALERRDLLADRRLDVAEARRGTPEGPLAGDRLERRQVAQLDPEPLIVRHDPLQRIDRPA